MSSPHGLWGAGIAALGDVAILRSLTPGDKRLNHTQNPNCLDLNMHEKLPRKDQNTHIHTYIVGKPDSSGVKNNKRQFPLWGKGAGKSVGPCAG